MRELKFRAWDKKENPTFSTEKYRLYDKDRGITQIYTLNELISKTFRKGKFEYRGKFTGLKDETIAEIFEGDILEFLNAPGMEDGICKVIWETDRGAWYIENDAFDIYSELYNIIGYCIVIDTIHENPELLLEGI